MIVKCKILSKDFLIYEKIKDFIKVTPFFLLEEGMNDDSEEQIIFWDVDTININIYSIENKIARGCLIFMISSLNSKEIIFQMLEKEFSSKVGFLRKNILYSHFVEEVSFLIDNKVPDTS